MSGRWEFWIDRGGTFTDCIGRGPDGRWHITKLLSSDAAPLAGMRSLLQQAEAEWSGRAETGSSERIEAQQPECAVAERPACAAGTGILGWSAAENFERAEAQRSDRPLPPCHLRLGTTLATNALLERRGVRTQVVADRGLGDVLAIGTQERPELFKLCIHKPPPLHEGVIEAGGRVDKDGRVLEPLNEEELRAALTQARRSGVHSIAVVRIHSYAHPEGERRIAEIAREVGFPYVVASHEVAREIGLLARGETAVADAYLTPLLRVHVAALERELPGSTLRFMQSSGGLTDAARFRGPTALLSGPAGGVVGAARVAAAAGFSDAISFDMGGTSTDVSLIQGGEIERAFESSVGGVRVKAPMLRIHTVAAGGGSLCRFDGFRLTVGPESAGADPGPLCYGRAAVDDGDARRRKDDECRVGAVRDTVQSEPGSRTERRTEEGAKPRAGLALTDMNFFLGRLHAGRFPFPLAREPVERAVAALAAEVRAAGHSLSPMELAAGFIEIANAHMAQAIQEVSIARGVDPRRFALVGFGGAAGQHVCAVARALGIRTVLLHPLAGVLSAYGIGCSELTWDRQHDAGRVPLPERGLPAAVEEALAELERAGRAALTEEGVARAAQRVERELDLRYAGTENALTLAEPEAEDWRAAFEREHRARFGYTRPGRAIEIATARCRVRGTASNCGESPLRASGAGPTGVEETSATLSDAVQKALGKSAQQRMQDAAEDRRQREREESQSSRASAAPQEAVATSLGSRLSPQVTTAPREMVRAWFSSVGWTQAPVWDREALVEGGELMGPAIVLEDTSTVVLDPGFRARVAADGLLVLSDEMPSVAAETPDLTRADPIRLEVFGSRFMSIAEQMGAVLRKTAVSTNIKERLDYSCAVFDAEGGLVANAPHIPVHLGAMGETVRAMRARFPDLAPGDAVVTNDPFEGGSHLPDITIVAPVFVASEDAAVSPARGEDPGVGSADVSPGFRASAGAGGTDVLPEFSASAGAGGADVSRVFASGEGSGGRARAPAFFVAARGHHADVGGAAPGSMPADSTRLEEEGVCLEAFRVVERGEFKEDELRARLTKVPFPARNPDDNVADLEAMLAATRAGERLLLHFVAERGFEAVQVTMRQLQEAAAAKVAREIGRLPDGEYRFEDAMDDGTPVCVTLNISGERMRIDFTGTGAAVHGNLNAPRAVVQAAVIYVLRALVDERIPLNGGCLTPVEIVVPPGSLLDPPRGAAVVGGNVETSQRVVDVLLGALGRFAASQGSMNNVTFGNERFGYYETLGGGAGAGENCPGASAVNSHMTNTRITDPELLETRYPVRLRAFALRRASGGRGRFPGGDGLLRRYEFLAPVIVSLLTERRVRAPYGVCGGAPGALGRNAVERVDGRVEEFPGKVTLQLAPGDCLVVETPGGGGYGALKSSGH